MSPSEGLKMLVSTMMTGHDDGNHADGPFEMATWDVSRAHFHGEARRWMYTYLPDGHEQEGSCHGDDFCVVASQKQLQIFEKVLEKQFEVKQTGHIGFSASDAKELKILNRTIKIDVLNDEMTLEADTKLVENALESMKLNGA